MAPGNPRIYAKSIGVIIESVMFSVNVSIVADIISDSDIIYIDLEPGIFTATFFDSNGKEIKDNIPNYDFDLESDFDDKLNVQTVNNSVLISTSDYKLNNKSFRLVLKADGYGEVTKDIKIREFL